MHNRPRGLFLGNAIGDTIGGMAGFGLALLGIWGCVVLLVAIAGWFLGHPVFE